MNQLSFSYRRVQKLILMFLLTLLGPCIAGIIGQRPLDTIIVWIFVSIFFYLGFLLYLEHTRVTGQLSRGMSNSFGLIFFVYLFGTLFTIAFSFLPGYCAPYMLFGIFCASAFEGKPGIYFSMYFACMAGMYNGGDDQVLTAVLLALLGALFCEWYTRSSNPVSISLFVICTSIAIPVCIQYLQVRQLQLLTIVITFAGAIVCSLFGIFLSPKLHYREVYDESISLDTIMDPAFHLQKEILKYSTADYNHAVKTSQVAARLAKEVAADEKLAAAGGFYYRVGKLEGEPFVENGIRLAQQNCFSERLIAILAEYNGQNMLPSSIESAIVHIADCLVTKFDLLDKDTFSSTWNRDIVVYQTMNEKSAEGLYDRSGLTMNQFLKIRELLVKEDLLS